MPKIFFSMFTCFLKSVPNMIFIVSYPKIYSHKFFVFSICSGLSDPCCQATRESSYALLSLLPGLHWNSSSSSAVALDFKVGFDGTFFY